MTRTDTASTAHTAHHTGPTLAVLPRAGDPAPVFAGFTFTADGTPPREPGVLVLTRRIGDRLYPALVADADDIAAAVADLRRRDPAAAEATDGLCWMQRAQQRQRSHIARDLSASSIRR